MYSKARARLRQAATLVALVCAGSSTPALARTHHHHVHHARHHVARYYGGSISYGGGYYTAVSGHRVHSPVRANSAPSGATARCRDSSWSFSESHRGTCSHHGGVASWL